MKKDNISIGRVDKNLILQKKKYFVGSVILHDISRIIKSLEQKIYLVTFQKGAKTKLHYHEAGQTLIVTEGIGKLVIYKKIKGTVKTGLKIMQISKIPLKKGDVVYIPKYTLHVHGSTNQKQKFSHIAINSHTSTGLEAKTIWFDSDLETFAKKIS
ncbi:MAG TPA: cupin domain-containing protein [Nitrosopumilaceae archaeon]|nr:cupin domain-containing protein [Nitrosopumilaceae archaeon]